MRFDRQIRAVEAFPAHVQVLADEVYARSQLLICLCATQILFHMTENVRLFLGAEQSVGY